MLGVGSGIDTFNLEVMSGFIKYQAGTNTLLTSDYSIGNFNSLADDLAAFIEELCRTTIITTKEVLGPICNGQVMFRFRIINLGSQSAATGVALTDTFPAGYDNPTYSGPMIKICFEGACDPVQPNNAFIWIPFSVPPLDTAELILTVDVLSGNHVNTSWVTADNANSVHATFNGVLTQDQPPTITCPANVTIGCGVSTLPPGTGNPTGNNPDGPPPTYTFSDVTVAGTCPIIKTITRTWTATDNCSNTATCTQTIVVKDVIGPTITCPANVTIPCQTNTLPPALGFATATDACDATPTITWGDVTVAGVCDLEFTILRTWTATDDCNNTSTCVQTIFVDDNTPPGLTCPKSITIACTDSTDPANTGGYATATNNCGGSATISYSDMFVTLPTCVLNRTWTAIDNCGNASTCLQTITMVDNSPPSINCPASVTISCTSSTAPGSTGTATSTDNCDAVPIVTYTDATASSTCPQAYVITRTWKSQDRCGNSSTCNQTISITDTSPPAITCPANITIQCNTSSLPGATGNATSTDNCDLAPIITFTDVTAAGSCPQAYSITRTWKSTDHCGNFNTCNQSIVIKDTTVPQISCPANVTILCTASTQPASTGTAGSTDNCDASPTITFTDVTTAGSCPQAYSITRTWKSTDHCGNFSTCNQSIVIIDNAAPSISCPANVTIECTVSTAPSSTGNPTSTDNCDASPIVTFTDATVGNGCPQAYTITRTWKSTDHCGNFNTCVQSIVVQDTHAPTLVCPANITVQCTASTAPSNTGSATATDNCDATPTITSTDVTTAGGCPQEYTISRTWKALDDCGNSSTCVQTIFVDDSNPPTLSCPINVTIQCTASTLPPNTGNATATDNCDLSATVTYSDVTVGGGCPQEYTITRTWQAVDDCSNSSTCVQVITIDDSMSPAITCPANVTLECTANTLPPDTGSAT
ncbi:MAG TPA: hypothetical protein VJ508_06290, partial [Saprospiraceae bacterium]|nr:hypothetical protein [Saprospiraceae bacterium]